MAATEETEALSSIERYKLREALTTLNEERGALRLEEIVARSGVDRPHVRRVMQRQASDDMNPVQRVEDDVWIVTEG